MVVAPRFLRYVLGGWAAVLSVALAGGLSGAALAQATGTDPVRPLGQANSSLSVASGQQLMSEASMAISDQNYVLAEEKLKQARDSFNQISTYYQELAQMFVGVDTQLNRSNREKALETAQLRDQATYQLALVYRSQNRPNEAVPLLMDILRSQQPTRELGQRAYQQLFELGFVDQPYTGRAATTTPAESATPDEPAAPAEPTIPVE
ncbi:MAG: hypothetical protein WBB18_02070 [Nodosilinea sp.]